MTVSPADGRSVDRHVIYDLLQIKKSLIVCPYHSGQQIAFLQLSCAPDEFSKIGKYSVEYFNRIDFFKEAAKCTPLLGIHGPDYKPQDPVISYLLINNSEKFEPGAVTNIDVDNLFDRNFRQFLNNIGAPVIYYNGMSNVICLSVREGENFSLVDAIHEFGFALPPDISVESSASSCPNWFKDRFGQSLPEPIFDH